MCDLCVQMAWINEHMCARVQFQIERTDQLDDNLNEKCLTRRRRRKKTLKR